MFEPLGIVDIEITKNDSFTSRRGLQKSFKCGRKMLKTFLMVVAIRRAVCATEVLGGFGQTEFQPKGLEATIADAILIKERDRDV